MLPVRIPPAYKGISIRTIRFPQDVNDLIEIHQRNDYHPSWSLQPDTKTIETFYRTFLDWSPYGAWLLSFRGTTMFLLELMPIDCTDIGQFYPAEPGDYSLGIKLNIGPDQEEIATQTLLAAMEGILTANPADIRRFIFPVSYNIPGSPLRNILGKAGFIVLKDQSEQGSPVIYELASSTLTTNPVNIISWK